MRASIDTQLSLFEWAKILGISPYEMAQIDEGFPNPRSADCAHTFFQYPYQRDYLSREEVARAIAEAETTIADWLGYWPAPKYIADEVISFPATYGSRFTSDRYPMYKAGWGMVQGTGVLTKTPVLGNVPLVLSDRDGDGINDTFTVTVAAPAGVTNPDEIHIYYVLTDRFNEAIAPQWEIRPINVVLSGGNFIITGHASLLVPPNLTEIINPVELDVTAATTYVTQVDVYREWLDTTVSATVMNQGWFSWYNPNIAFQPIYVKAQNQDQGILHWHVFNDSCLNFGVIPDKIHTNYLAGVARNGHFMDRSMAEIVTYLSTTFLAEDACGCDRTSRILAFWRGLPSDQSDRRPLSLKEIDSPWGPRNGALMAWQRVQNIFIIKGVSA